MVRKMLLAAALIAMVAPASSMAYTGTLKFKGGCAAKDTGMCTLGVTGTQGSVKVYAAPAMNGHYGAVTKAFTAPGTKRIANSSNNVCFYAKRLADNKRTREICLK